MREVDFTEKNLWNRWLGVNIFWKILQGDTKKFVKVRLERAMRAEADSQVGCGRYERSFGRRGYRNGRYSRDLLTSYGWIEGLEVPRVRQGGLESKILERYRRRQRQVDRLLLEAFLLGHATRKTGRVFKGLFGGSISPQTVSNIVHELDDEVRGFHRRRLGDDYRFVYFDGLWVTLSRPVKLRKVLLVALGIRPDGSKDLLGFQLAANEGESCWWGFLSDLKSRGLKGQNLEVIVSDGAAGLVKAITALYPRISHQRCVLHHCRNLEAHLTDKRHLRPITAQALQIFEAATETELRQRLHIFTDRWWSQEPKAVRVFLRGVENCLTYLEYPDPWRTSLKTNNPIERYLEEVRRRIIPMRHFNNDKSVNRIIYGIIAYVLNNQNQDMLINQFTQPS